MSAAAEAATAEIERDLAAIDAVLAGWMEHRLAGWPAVLALPARHALESGGKRLRPLFCLAAYRAVRAAENVPRAAVALACSIELIHTYSLVHDDLPCMDDAALRRGRTTPHRVYGAAPAALAGAGLIGEAFLLLDEAARELGLGAHVRAALARELAAGAGAAGMVGGQVLDLAAEGRRPAHGSPHAASSELAELTAIHRRKTGALLVAAVRIGARAGGGGDAALAAMTRYGAAIGLAFQITDDLLDVTEAPAVTGKSGGDAGRAKATFPALLGVAEARRRAEEELDRGVLALGAADLETPALRVLARRAVRRDR